MRLRSLRFPDLALWHLDPLFSPLVRAALITAYSLLNQTPNALDAYVDAVAALEPVFDAPMSVRQRIRVYYVMGLAFAAVGNYPRALFCLDNATEMGYAQGDPGDLLDLLYVRGSVNRGALRYRDAATDYREYLAINDFTGGFRPDALDAPLVLDVILQLAGAEFFLANYDAAQRLLEKASPLLPYVSLDVEQLDTSTAEAHLLAGTYSWFQSQLYRWRGMPEMAMMHATGAARIYTAFGSTASAARSQLVMAEIALDVATRVTQEGERRFLALVAKPHIDQARQLVNESGGPVGACLCDLLRMRMSRLAGEREDRISVLGEIAQTGQKLGDEAIMAQAFTALGDELSHLGHVEAAVYRYRDVRNVLDGSDVPALEVWARRGEHKLWEQHPYL